MRTCLALIFVLVLGLMLVRPALAQEFPKYPNLYFQTSGRERVPGIGDWYTTKTSASTDRVHRVSISITEDMLAAGNVTILIKDAESNGALDEVDGFTGVFSATTSDPTRYQLLAPGSGPGHDVVLAEHIVPTGSPNGQTRSFVVTPAMGAGTYQVSSVTGAYPIYGDPTPALNNDDNTWFLEVNGAAVTNILLGSLQGTFQQVSGSIQTISFFFLVGPGTSWLQLRNFDLDLGGTVTYIRPDGTTIAGTASGNGVWNGRRGTLNSGGDTISGLTNSDYGIWTMRINNFTSGNQTALEALAEGNKVPLYDVTPTTAGNFSIASTGSLSTAPLTPVDHPFTVTNNFTTGDVVDLTLSGTDPNYTVSLLTSAGVPLTDTNGDGNLDTGVLASGATGHFILRVTPGVGAGSSSTTRISGVSFLDRTVDPANNVTLFIDRTTTLANAISGTVYEDLDRNASRGSGETGIGVSGLYVKLVPTGGGPATQAAAVDPTTGAWSMPVAASGDYVLVLDTNDTLSDVTPTYPPGWIGTECPAGQRPLSVASDAVTGQDFGLWRGSTLTGTVFIDDGAGGGVPNDGLRQAGEAPLGGVKVRALQGGVLLDETTTDVDGHYILYLPFSAGGSQVVIEEINPTGFISVGGHPGTTGGSYDLPSDSTTFLYNVSVASYTGVNFGDVSSLLFFPDNQGQGSPGGVLFYTHTFQAGTAGSVSFTLERVSIPSQLNWSSVLYRDSNGNGVVDPGESVVNGPISLAAGEELMLVLKEFIPPNAPLGAQDQVKITAHFSPDNSSEIIELSRTDLTLVTGASGMLLHKAVDSALATSGDVLTYTITYSNSGSEGIAALVVTDVTPAYTTFVSAAHGPLPTGLSGVVLTTPGVGAEGAISWTFTGILPPGGEGTVTFQVKVD